MTEQDKQLFLQDLCARLPYGVKVQYKDKIFDIEYISPLYEEVKLDTPNNYTVSLSEIKPYLRPMSSMTEEEKAYKESYFKWDYTAWDYVDWLNKNKFDYRGLIPLGLGIDCTGLNIY